MSFRITNELDNDSISSNRIDTDSDILFSGTANRSRNPSFSKGTVWVRDDDPTNLIFTDSSLVDHVLSGGGGGSNIHDVIAGPNFNTTSVWSNQFAESRGTVLANNAITAAFTPGATYIDDAVISTTKLWSSDRIDTALSGLATIADVNSGVGFGTANVWSNSKTQYELYQNSDISTVATTNIASLSGLVQTIDGVALFRAGQRVLLTAQTNPIDNGLYVIQSGAWTRDNRWISGLAVAKDQMLYVAGGLNDGKKIYRIGSSTKTGAIIGTDPIYFVTETSLIKDSVLATSTGNLSLTGAIANVDGVVLTTGVSRILAKDQTVPSENGIYIYNSTGAWPRSSDWTGEIAAGSSIYSVGGTANGNKTFTLTGPIGSTFTVGTDTVFFAPNNVTVYVDGALGLDTNDGLSTAAPFKTLLKAFSYIRDSGWDDVARIRVIGVDTELSADSITKFSTGTLGKQTNPITITGHTESTVLSGLVVSTYSRARASGTITADATDDASNMLTITTTTSPFNSTHVGKILRFATGPYTTYVHSITPMTPIVLEVYIAEVLAANIIRVAFTDLVDGTIGDTFDVIDYTASIKITTALVPSSAYIFRLAKIECNAPIIFHNLNIVDGGSPFLAMPFAPAPFPFSYFGIASNNFNTEYIGVRMVVPTNHHGIITSANGVCTYGSAVAGGRVLPHSSAPSVLGFGALPATAATSTTFHRSQVDINSPSIYSNSMFATTNTFLTGCTLYASYFKSQTIINIEGGTGILHGCRFEGYTTINVVDKALLADIYVKNSPLLPVSTLPYPYDLTFGRTAIPGQNLVNNRKAVIVVNGGSVNIGDTHGDSRAVGNFTIENCSAFSLCQNSGKLDWTVIKQQGTVTSGVSNTQFNISTNSAVTSFVGFYIVVSGDASGNSSTPSLVTSHVGTLITVVAPLTGAPTGGGTSVFRVYRGDFNVKKGANSKAVTYTDSNGDLILENIPRLTDLGGGPYYLDYVFMFDSGKGYLNWSTVDIDFSGQSNGAVFFLTNSSNVIKNSRPQSTTGLSDSTLSARPTTGNYAIEVRNGSRLTYFGNIFINAGDVGMLVQNNSYLNMVDGALRIFYTAGAYSTTNGALKLDTGSRIDVFDYILCQQNTGNGIWLSNSDLYLTTNSITSVSSVNGYGMYSEDSNVRCPGFLQCGSNRLGNISFVRGTLECRGSINVSAYKSSPAGSSGTGVGSTFSLLLDRCYVRTAGSIITSPGTTTPANFTDILIRNNAIVSCNSIDGDLLIVTSNTVNGDTNLSNSYGTFTSGVPPGMVGMTVSGPGIQFGTTIIAFIDSNNVTLSLPATATARFVDLNFAFPPAGLKGYDCVKVLDSTLKITSGIDVLDYSRRTLWAERSDVQIAGNISVSGYRSDYALRIIDSNLRCINTTLTSTVAVGGIFSERSNIRLGRIICNSILPNTLHGVYMSGTELHADYITLVGFSKGIFAIEGSRLLIKVISPFADAITCGNIAEENIDLESSEAIITRGILTLINTSTIGIYLGRSRLFCDSIITCSNHTVTGISLVNSTLECGALVDCDNNTNDGIILSDGSKMVTTAAVTGTGNGNVGMNIAKGSTFIGKTSATITGTLGDVIVGQNGIRTWTNVNAGLLSATNDYTLASSQLCGCYTSA